MSTLRTRVQRLEQSGKAIAIGQHFLLADRRLGVMTEEERAAHFLRSEDRCIDEAVELQGQIRRDSTLSRLARAAIRRRLAESADFLAEVEQAARVYVPKHFPVTPEVLAAVFPQES